MQRYHLVLHHTVSEGNAITEALATLGIGLDRVTFFSTFTVLPSRVRRAVARDAWAFVDPGG